MKKLLLAGIARPPLLMAAARPFGRTEVQAGRGARFHWADFDALKKVDLKGETLTIFGPWRGDDEELVQSILDYFREATGADVKYSSSENYEQQIVIDTQAGIPPNIAVLPQPGLLADLASKGLLVPLGDDTANWLNDNYGAGESWVQLGSYKDKDGATKFFALPLQGRPQEPGLVLAGELQGRRLHRSADHGRTGRAVRQDRQGRRQAVVHRPWLGWRHRLAGDRLGRGYHAAHAAGGRLRQVGDQRGEVRRPGRRRRDRHVRLVRQE